MGKRKEIVTRDEAEKVARRIMRDSEALFFSARNGWNQRDEIMPLNDLKNESVRVWQLVLRRNFTGAPSR